MANNAGLGSLELCEIEDLSLELYKHLNVDPLHPPGAFRMAVVAWGPAAFRYVDHPLPDPDLQDGEGWVLQLARGARSDEMTMGIGVALARWTAARTGCVLDEESERLLAFAIVMPAPALRNNAIRCGLTISETADLFGVHPSAVVERLARVLSAGSGERPSAKIRAAKKS